MTTPAPPPVSLSPHIFPTCDRGKHGKTVSFPAGAEVLSRALDGVPQHALIGCHFIVADMERRPVKPLEHVLHVVYSKQVRSQHHGKDADVFAIPSTMRHLVKTLLVRESLPNVVRPWLLANADITGRSGSRGLMIMLDTANSVLVHETRDGILPDRV
jgi:hypothetical protein